MEITSQNYIELNNLLKKLKLLKDNQKLLMKDMSKERCDDIHSVRRSINLGNGIIELEVKIQFIIDLISSIKS